MPLYLLHSPFPPAQSTYSTTRGREKKERTLRRLGITFIYRYAPRTQMLSFLFRFLEFFLLFALRLSYLCLNVQKQKGHIECGCVHTDPNSKSLTPKTPVCHRVGDVQIPLYKGQKKLRLWRGLSCVRWILVPLLGYVDSDAEIKGMRHGKHGKVAYAVKVRDSV